MASLTNKGVIGPPGKYYFQNKPASLMRKNYLVLLMGFLNPVQEMSLSREKDKLLFLRFFYTKIFKININNPEKYRKTQFHFRQHYLT